jgi:hypothetical protein
MIPAEQIVPGATFVLLRTGDAIQLVENVVIGRLTKTLIITTAGRRIDRGTLIEKESRWPLHLRRFDDPEVVKARKILAVRVAASKAVDEMESWNTGTSRLNQERIRAAILALQALDAAIEASK